MLSIKDAAHCAPLPLCKCSPENTFTLGESCGNVTSISAETLSRNRLVSNLQVQPCLGSTYQNILHSRSPRLHLSVCHVTTLNACSSVCTDHESACNPAGFFCSASTSGSPPTSFQMCGNCQEEQIVHLGCLHIQSQPKRCNRFQINRHTAINPPLAVRRFRHLSRLWVTALLTHADHSEVELIRDQINTSVASVQFVCFFKYVEKVPGIFFFLPTSDALMSQRGMEPNFCLMSEYIQLSCHRGQTQQVPFSATAYRLGRTKYP